MEINTNKEVVGVVHDVNIKSLAGHTIFLEARSRIVSIVSEGLIEVLKYLYKTERIGR